MRMEQEKEWDVEQFKMEHESDEHWELRRRFLLAHKDRFLVDELLCLAQVFTNIEFLGCRYPEETMELVAELSKDIAANYREKQKTKLQRTFVKASDAAGAKVKGLNFNKPQISKSNKLSSMRYTEDKPDSSDVKKKFKLDHTCSTQNIQKQSENGNIISMGPFGNIVMIEHPHDNCINVLTNAVNASGQNLEWIFDESSTECKCEIKINTKKLIDGHGQNKKLAKKNTATHGVEVLKKYYYTIKVKRVFREKSESVISTESVANASPTEDMLSNDNVGRKLMLLMGWSGGGLGKSQQGIVDPVTIKQQISREGLGLKSEKYSQNILKKKFQDLLKNFLNGDMRTDLVFSSEFTNEERALIHQVARQMGLKSHSHGPKDSRILIVSPKIDSLKLLTELKKVGVVMEKYELISPTEAVSHNQ